MRRTVLLLVVMVTAMLLAASGVALAATTVGGVPDAGTVQTDGQLSAVLAAGGKIYLGGSFTHVNGVPRNRLAAVDAATGQLTTWDPNANDAVRALAFSPDGTRIYAGGQFTSVGGVYRGRLAAINASSGAVDDTWTPKADAAVRAIAVRGANVYVGGKFATVNGLARARLALLGAGTGSLDPAFAPSVNDWVRTLAVSADGTRLYVGGEFNSVGGLSRPYLASLNPATGALDGAWSQPTTPNGPVFDLQESAGRLYAAEGGPGGALTAYDPSTGKSLWRKGADGDVQALTVLGGEVYAGGHFVKFSGYDRKMFAAVDAVTGTTDQNWAPSASGADCSSVWAPDPCIDWVWALEADPSIGRLYAGGDFRQVSGGAHAGFARFSYPPVASDTVPPETTIDSGPSGTVNTGPASFAFSSSEAGSTFECSLDGSLYSPCSSPRSYTGLADGTHTFSVRATDAAGNVDPTPATRSWTVDTLAPDAPIIVNPPDNSTTAANFALSGSAEAGSTVEVFDGPLSVGTTRADASGAWSKALSNVSGGTHTYTARATDAAGNASGASNTKSVNVDATVPDTTITSGPSGTVNSTDAAFAFTSTEAGSTFECSLDGGTYAPCTSPKSYTALANGSHTFSVRATDTAGNVDPTPASRTWKVQVSGKK
jgi:hypothetical protein